MRIGLLPTALGAALLAAGAIAVSGGAPGPAQVTVTSPTQQQARPAVQVVAREEDTQSDDWSLREYLRRLRRLSAVQHRSPGDRAHKSWKKARRG